VRVAGGDPGQESTQGAGAAGVPTVEPLIGRCWQSVRVLPGVPPVAQPVEERVESPPALAVSRSPTPSMTAPSTDTAVWVTTMSGLPAVADARGIGATGSPGRCGATLRIGNAGPAGEPADAPHPGSAARNVRKTATRFMDSPPALGSRDRAPLLLPSIGHRQKLLEIDARPRHARGEPAPRARSAADGCTWRQSHTLQRQRKDRIKLSP
jgi:hypothetical protein